MTDFRAAIIELCTELTACAHESQPPVAEAFAYAVEKLRELCAQYGWQPIESAPRGRTRIIVFRPVFDGTYIPQVGMDYFDHAYNGGTWMLSNRNTQPTMWQPFPDVVMPEAPRT